MRLNWALKRALFLAAVVGCVFACIVLQVAMSADETWQTNHRYSLDWVLVAFWVAHWPIRVLLERSSGGYDTVLIVAAYWIVIAIGVLLFSWFLLRGRVRRTAKSAGRHG